MAEPKISLAVDVIIRTPKGIVLIDRKTFPKGWALPGGFVEYGETIKQAAAREAKEETGLDVRIVRHFHTYTDPKRDPRGYVISAVFVADAKGKIKSRARSDVKNVKIFTKKTIPKRMVFDHAKILRDYFSDKY
ncbi:MAG: NUDIX hydrolase [Candidatus Micrarchaeia archaeon]